MRGQLYRGHANATLCSVVQWSVYWAPSRTTRVPGQAVEPLRRAEKKKRAPLLGLAKSIYYSVTLQVDQSFDLGADIHHSKSATELTPPQLLLCSS